MFNRRLNTFHNMFMVELEPADNNKEIYDTQSLDHCVVKIEPPHPREEVLQCHRCQAFGHTKNFCHRQPNCVPIPKHYLPNLVQDAEQRQLWKWF